jgi:3',5'-cyclic AMP phosphodiesterase CpdA
MLKSTRHPGLSLWQSAVDEVVVKSEATQNPPAGDPTPPSAGRPAIQNQHMVASAAADVAAAEKGESVPGAAPTASDAAARGTPDVVKYCSTLARNVLIEALKSDPTGASLSKQQLTAQMGVCDPRWVDVILQYQQFVASRKPVPYIVHQDMSSFVIDGGVLPEKARVVILGDWGTGQSAARQVLAQIARKKPDVVIHLGDIYYSCTDFEANTYFYGIWITELDLGKIRTFTLSGNHDMYSGGQAYYDLLDKLKQPASYFCLRNAHWQLLAMDTGLNDRVPDGSAATYLQDTEAAWLIDKVNHAEGRRTTSCSVRTRTLPARA